MEYGAIDLHLRHSLIRIVDETGALVLDRRITTTRDGFERVFAGRPPVRILIESGTESEWWRGASTCRAARDVWFEPNLNLQSSDAPHYDGPRFPFEQLKHKQSNDAVSKTCLRRPLYG
jgi:hypothetical protein